MLTSNLVLDDVLFSVVRGIGEALDVWECDLYEYSAAGNSLTSVSCWVREPTPADLAWVGTVVDLTGRPGYHPVIFERRIAENHIDDEGLDPVDRALMEKWSELTTVSVPLVFGEEVIGCLVLIEKRAVRRFTDEERELLADLSVPAAIAIHNAKMFQRQREQNRQLASLLDSSRAIASTVVLEDVLSLVARKAAEALAVPQVGIYEYDRRQDAIVRVSTYVEGETEVDHYLGQTFPLRDWPRDRKALESGEAFVDLVSDGGIDPAMRESMLRYGQKSALTVPFAFGNQTTGLIHLVETTHERRFTDEEVELARGLGEQAAVAIENAKLYELEQERSKRLLGLLDASQAIAAPHELAAALTRLAHEVGGLLGGGTTHVDVFLRGAGGAYLPFSVAIEEEGREAAPEAPPEEQSEPDEVVRRALASASAVQEAKDGVARLVVPLMVKDEPQGYIDAGADRDGAFPEGEVELVQIIANQAAVSIENARLYRTIEEQAITDGLTDLYNYRHFYRRLEEEVAKSRRYETPLSLLMLDLDDFKRFNDRYGHPLGDRVLREVAEILRRQLRDKVDLPARYGGEEFAVLLPNTPMQGAQTVGDRLQKELAALGEDLLVEPGGAHGVGERIRRSVEDARFEGDAGGPRVRVTVSVGIACMPDHARDGERLVGCADKALYLAKRMGKNRVETYS